jgi:hypothetical protein
MNDKGAVLLATLERPHSGNKKGSPAPKGITSFVQVETRTTLWNNQGTNIKTFRFNEILSLHI